MSGSHQAVVVGMGPAGLGAALELARAGVATALVDQAAAPGGRVLAPPPAGLAIPPALRPARLRQGEALRRELTRAGGRLTLYQGAVAWGAFAPGRLSLLQDGRLMELDYRRLLVCEGAQERVVPCPGWTLPGVMALGGMQQLVERQGVAPGRRVLLAGSSPLLPATADLLARAGVGLAGWCEANPLTRWAGLGLGLLSWPRLIPESLRHLAGLLGAGTRPRFGWGLLGLAGDDRVREATIARLDAEGAPLPGTAETLAVDAVGIGHGFLPATRLGRLLGCRMAYDPLRRGFAPLVDQDGQSSLPGVYLAGDGAAIGGADGALIAGHLAGLHAAFSLGKLSRQAWERAAAPWRRQARRLAPYLRRFHRVFTPRPGQYRSLPPETVICRCEGVTAGQLRAEFARGARDLAALKPLRLAMGPCQGRGCEALAAELLRAEGVDPGELSPLNLRPPLVPLPLGVFAAAPEGEELP